MGRLAIVEDDGGAGPEIAPAAPAAPEEENMATNNNEVASSSSTAPVDSEKRKAGNSDESGYLSNDDDDDAMSSDSIEIIFEKKGNAANKNNAKEAKTLAQAVLAASSQGKTISTPIFEGTDILRYGYAPLTNSLRIDTLSAVSADN